MTLYKRFYFEPLQSIGFGSISGVYAAVGTALPAAAQKVKFQNLTNANITLSLDGTGDHDLIPINGFALYDCTTEGDPNQVTPQIAAGTIFYVKGTPSSGSFYVTTTGAY